MTPLKRHRFITFLLLFACLSLSLSTGAQRRKRNSASGNDSLKVDSALVDTLSIDTVAPKKKQPLDAPVIYEANDSIVFTEGGYAHLYGDGKVNYEKIELTSAVITMNMDSSTVYARGVDVYKRQHDRRTAACFLGDGSFVGLRSVDGTDAVYCLSAFHADLRMGDQETDAPLW